MPTNDPFDFTANKNSYATDERLRQLKLNAASLLTTTNVAAVLAAKGLSDAQARALIGNASSLTSGLIAAGFNVVDIAATPTPSPIPTISFSTNTVAINEGDSGTTTVTNTVNVNRNGVTGALVVNLTTGGTATPDVDFISGPSSVVIANAANSASYMRVINGDTSVETNETIIEQAALAAYPTATASKTITITNDDVTVVPTPTVTISSAQSKVEGNSGSTAYVYTVSRSTAIGATSIPWSFQAGSTSADDFAGGVYPSGGFVNLADGISSGIITINVSGDAVFENDESFSVLISTPSGYVAGSSTSATGTILNDDLQVIVMNDPTGLNLGASYRPTYSKTGTSVFTYYSNYDPQVLKSQIIPQATYYVNLAGNNNNDGLTTSSKLKSKRLAIAMAKALAAPAEVVVGSALPSDPPVIYKDSDTQARSGQTAFNATWGSAWKTDNPVSDIIIRPDIPGGIWYNVQDIAPRAFAATSDANIYVATGTSSQLSSQFYDFANRDPVNYSPRKLILLQTAPADPANPWPELNALCLQSWGLLARCYEFKSLC
jgi:hypothetical protein